MNHTSRENPHLAFTPFLFNACNLNRLLNLNVLVVSYFNHLQMLNIVGGSYTDAKF